MAKSPFQVLDRLRPEEFEALKADIAERGCLVPVEVDEDGHVLDGHHRVEICEELGIRYKKLVRTFASREDKVVHALKLNLLRRNLGPIAWATAFRKLCQVRGVRLGKGRQNGKSDTMSQIARELGVEPRTAQRRVQLEQRLESYPDLVEKVETGEMDSRRAIRLAKQRVAQQRRDRQRVPRVLPDGIRIAHCDFRKLDIEDGSVDLVFTDPPYVKDCGEIFAALGEWAVAKLRPDGVLLAYGGKMYLPQIVEALGRRLTYVWTCCVFHKGQLPKTFPYKISQASNLLYLFVNGEKFKPHHWLVDSVMGGTKEKELHPWQKHVSEGAHFISALTNPGQLVVDPFLGSGTTAVAAMNLGRRFVGCDLDQHAVATAKRRVAQMRAPGAGQPSRGPELA